MSAGEERVCARADCDTVYVKKKHNQKYCCDECTRIQMNMHIMEKYRESRDRRLGKPRTCKSCGVTKLSRYNEDQVCSACNSKSIFDANNSVLDMLNRAIS